MISKPLSRLLYVQGGKCFFCAKELPPAEASVEHLVATANGGGNSEDNCVACCKALNALLGRMSIKEKIRVILNQNGNFQCPKDIHPETTKAPKEPEPKADEKDRLAAVLEDLRRRGAARPGSLKTLKSTISAHFKKTLSEEEIDLLVESLKASGAVVVTGSKVSYEF